MNTLPSSVKCTCARSPSYLYSHVNSWSANFSSTSAMPFVALASIGFTGTPGVNLTWSGSSCSTSQKAQLTKNPMPTPNSTLVRSFQNNMFLSSPCSRAIQKHAGWLRQGRRQQKLGQHAPEQTCKQMTSAWKVTLLCPAAVLPQEQKHSTSMFKKYKFSSARSSQDQSHAQIPFSPKIRVLGNLQL